jgi:hypothetical protein
MAVRLRLFQAVVANWPRAAASASPPVRHAGRLAIAPTYVSRERRMALTTFYLSTKDRSAWRSAPRVLPGALFLKRAGRLRWSAVAFAHGTHTLNPRQLI